jgi:hypothetical protein
LGKSGQIHKIEGARVMDSLQGWNRNPQKESKKTPQIMKSKIEAKIPLKIMKMKNGAAHRETRFNPNHNYIEANQMFTRCRNYPNILPLV